MCKPNYDLNAVFVHMPYKLIKQPSATRTVLSNLIINSKTQLYNRNVCIADRISASPR